MVPRVLGDAQVGVRCFVVFVTNPFSVPERNGDFSAACRGGRYAALERIGNGLRRSERIRSLFGYGWTPFAGGVKCGQKKPRHVTGVSADFLDCGQYSSDPPKDPLLERFFIFSRMAATMK